MKYVLVDKAPTLQCGAQSLGLVGELDTRLPDLEEGKFDKRLRLYMHISTRDASPREVPQYRRHKFTDNASCIHFQCDSA